MRRPVIAACAGMTEGVSVITVFGPTYLPKPE